MTEWDKFFDKKVKEISKEKNILDVGGGGGFQKYLKEYKKYFKDSNYKTLDSAKEYKPDVLGDICNIPVADESIDAVICWSVLEHVQDPAKAVKEIYRILKNEGKVLVSVPFLYPYHAQKDIYKDYYRFTEDGVRHLFKNFSKIEICKVKGFFGVTVGLLPSKLLKKVLVPLANLLDTIFKTRSLTAGYSIFLVK